MLTQKTINISVDVICKVIKVFRNSNNKSRELIYNNQLYIWDNPIIAFSLLNDKVNIDEITNRIWELYNKENKL